MELKSDFIKSTYNPSTAHNERHLHRILIILVSRFFSSFGKIKCKSKVADWVKRVNKLKQELLLYQFSLSRSALLYTSSSGPLLCYGLRA